MFIPKSYKVEISEKKYQSKAPSNIALVKYWGKKQGQIPANSSLSFTLTNCYTETSVKISEKKSSEKFCFSFYFEGQEKKSFHPKILSFFEKIEDYLPFLKKFHLEIHSKNSFPHSSGIASSASSMAALSLCLMQIEREFSEDISEEFFLKKASFLARLGSGSACRSIYPFAVVWGETSCLSGSSELYGVKIPSEEMAPIFKNYQDTILLIDQGEKKVSSTQGHNLMHNHPFAEKRFLQAEENIKILKEILKQGDIKKFIELVESEALTLHAMMLTSLPYFILIKPNTLSAIEKIWKFREETALNLCFTLDAGANIHLLYPENEKNQILPFIEKELSVFCQNGKYICDEVSF